MEVDGPPRRASSWAMARPTTPPPMITWSKSSDLGVDVDDNLLGICLGLLLPIRKGKKVGA